MSGGHFDYQQYHIEEMANSIEEYLYGRELDVEDIEYYINHFFPEPSDEEKAWVRKYKRTLPNIHELSRETLNEFRKGVKLLRKAYIYAQRIDWLLSGDDGEESFHERLKEELETLKKGNR